MYSCDGNKTPFKWGHEQALAGPGEEASVHLSNRQAMSETLEGGQEGEMATVMGEVERICWTVWSIVSGALKTTLLPL